jgi:Fe2+ or Zn2+ uptake regulation protein
VAAAVGEDALVGDVCARLRAAGMRVTPQRRRLVALFASLGHWCTPQELFAEAAAVGQRQGLATVYRLIEALEEIGLCRSFAQTDHTLRYVFCPPFHHHHLICRDCGRVDDLRDCHVPEPRGEFAISDHAVDFFGTCHQCQGDRGS